MLDISIRDWLPMKYMLLMYADPNETKAMAASNRDIIARKHKALVARLTESGELLNGNTTVPTGLRLQEKAPCSGGPTLAPASAAPPLRVRIGLAKNV
jgi:hypothetical protein